MSVATSEPQELKLASREAVVPPAEMPVNVTEKAAQAVKDIVGEQRVQLLTELTPDLVDTYKSFNNKEGRAPTFAELAGAAKLSEQELLVKLGRAAFDKAEH